MSSHPQKMVAPSLPGMGPGPPGGKCCMFFGPGGNPLARGPGPSSPWGTGRQESRGVKYSQWGYNGKWKGVGGGSLPIPSQATSDPNPGHVYKATSPGTPRAREITQTRTRTPTMSSGCWVHQLYPGTSHLNQPRSGPSDYPPARAPRTVGVDGL